MRGYAAGRCIVLCLNGYRFRSWIVSVIHCFLMNSKLCLSFRATFKYYERHDRAAGVVHRFRFVNDIALNASHTDVQVNVIEYWEMGAAKVQHCSWVTDLRVTKGNVYRLMRGGRARWKIENET